MRWPTAQLEHIPSLFIGEHHRLEVELKTAGRRFFEQLSFEAIGTLVFEQSALGLVQVVYVISKERLNCTYEYKNFLSKITSTVMDYTKNTRSRTPHCNLHYDIQVTLKIEH